MVTELVGGRRARLRISNRQSFVGVDRFVCAWELWVGDSIAAKGKLSRINVAPHRSAEIDLPCDVPAGDDEVLLTVRWLLRTDTWYAPKGHLAAIDQVTLRSAKPNRRSRPSRAGSSSDERSQVDDLLASPIELALWRAPVDNDGFKLIPDLSKRLNVGGQGLRLWRRAGVDTKPADTLVEHKLQRTVYDDGRSVTYYHSVVVPDYLADLPRIGVTFSLPGGFDRLRWFGRGPHENYPDRKSSATIGIWNGAPDIPPYLVPQEFGLRSDCRWLECIDSSAGRRLRIDALRPSALHMAASNYSAEALTEARNVADLVASQELIVRIDVAHRGLGTASCGPDVLGQYRIGTGRFEFAYRISLS